MTNQKAVLFKPADAIRGISNLDLQYYLTEEADSVTFEILDSNGNIITSFSGDQPKYKRDPNIPWWQREPAKPTTAKGLNTYSWNLRFPGATTFEGMIIWSGRPANGPKAPLGNYKIRIKVDDYSETHNFEIKIDPNLKGITKEDLQEQFDLASKIMSKTSTANEAVIKIRDIKSQLSDAKRKISSADYNRTIDPFVKKISAIEEDLYQVKNQSGQDPLNFPIKLNNRLASLRRSVETGDAKPTAGAYKVFKELSDELDQHLSKLDQTLSSDLSKINQLLKKAGKKKISK
jgi:hypothetical protein